jgi:glycosyltransferase involved in cell wall biosynthesis
MERNRMSIFVSIAAYRDPECQYTVESLLNQASNSDNIKIGVLWQNLPEDGECFANRVPQQVSLIECNALSSKGACWSKNISNLLYSGQDYFLLIDSHSRLIKDWDKLMIEVLLETKADNPILSTYPTEYTPPNNCSEYTVHMAISKFTDSGVLDFQGIRHDNISDFAFTKPKRTPLLSGGFIFSKGNFIEECPYDPNLYFRGEEMSMSVRAFTHGWDSFSPNIRLVNHYYDRICPRHWDDNNNWNSMEVKSVQKIQDMLDGQDVGIYGLGTKRTLKEFEELAGVNFETKEIKDFALAGEFGE